MLFCEKFVKNFPFGYPVIKYKRNIKSKLLWYIKYQFFLHFCFIVNKGGTCTILSVTMQPLLVTQKSNDNFRYYSVLSWYITCPRETFLYLFFIFVMMSSNKVNSKSITEWVFLSDNWVKKKYGTIYKNKEI